MIMWMLVLASVATQQPLPRAQQPPHLYPTEAACQRATEVYEGTARQIGKSIYGTCRAVSEP